MSGQKSVLVTGGSGFIGTALCKKLVESGYQVWVLTRNAKRASAKLSSQVACVANLDDLPRDQIRYVVNLAGENLASGRWSSGKKQRFRDSRIGTTERLVEWCANQTVKPSGIVSGSAIGWYGPDWGSQTINEAATSIPGGFSQQLCADWESAAEKFVALDVRVCLLRIGVVIHPTGGALKQMLPAFRMGAGGRLGSGKQWFSWISLEDVVEVILFLLEREGLSGVFNGTSPNPVTNQAFTSALSRQLAIPALLPMPSYVLNLLFGEMARELLLSSHKVIPERIIQAGYTFKRESLESALKVLADI